MILLTTATEVEARFAIQTLKLKKQQNPYCNIWKNEEIILVVSGIGKIKAASAIAYCFAITKPEIKAAINFGLAGHESLTPGTTFLAHKITNSSSKASYYPGISFSFEGITCNLTSFDLPYCSYELGGGYDMEGAAFFETCLNFLPLDLIHSLKTVSDSDEAPLKEKIDKDFFLSLMKNSFPILNNLISTLSSVKKNLLVPPKIDFSFFTAGWSFTQSEKNILSDLLQRLMILEKTYDKTLLKTFNKAQVFQYLKSML